MTRLFVSHGVYWFDIHGPKGRGKAGQDPKDSKQ